jgi:hypothetical protein
MERGTQNWNDARLDDLNERMQAGFRHVDERFNSLEGRFSALEARFDSLQRTMLLVMASILVSTVAGKF